MCFLCEFYVKKAMNDFYVFFFIACTGLFTYTCCICGFIYYSRKYTRVNLSIYIRYNIYPHILIQSNSIPFGMGQPGKKKVLQNLNGMLWRDL